MQHLPLMTRSWSRHALLQATLVAALSSLHCASRAPARAFPGDVQDGTLACHEQPYAKQVLSGECVGLENLCTDNFYLNHQWDKRTTFEFTKPPAPTYLTIGKTGEGKHNFLITLCAAPGIAVPIEATFGFLARVPTADGLVETRRLRGTVRILPRHTPVL